MELKIEPALQSQYPLKGLAIKSARAQDWLLEIDQLGLSATNFKLYPLPDVTPNSVWGCFLIGNFDPQQLPVRGHYFFQMVFEGLYIPERSKLNVQLSKHELQKLFPRHINLYHPAIGMVELQEELVLSSLLAQPQPSANSITVPQPGISAPFKIKSFQVQPVPAEEVMKNLEAPFTPGEKPPISKPLNPLEQIKRVAYSTLFSKNKDGQGKEVVGKSEFGQLFTRLVGKFFGKEGEEKIDQLQQDFESLEERNQKEVDRLMTFMQKNPEEAIKYAIPLDDNATSRGGDAGLFTMSMRWGSTSLFSSGISSGGSGSINLGNSYFELQRQYNATAEEFIKKKEYEKAAFVYLKLLKNFTKAAESLEQGGMYREAASIYLKHTSNKLKAAECFERGNLTQDAIQVYKELKQDEKVADLYRLIGKEKEALHYYNQVVEFYLGNHQSLKAALIRKEKMHDLTGCQTLLLGAWRQNKDAVNCLRFCFANMKDSEQRGNEIKNIYKKEVQESNQISFLYVLRDEFKQRKELKEMISDMACQIIDAKAEKDPFILSELKAFFPDNSELLKDTLRYKLRLKKM
jgi:tetratricopeptide (TPR) repeat protein